MKATCQQNGRLLFFLTRKIIFSDAENGVFLLWKYEENDYYYDKPNFNLS